VISKSKSLVLVISVSLVLAIAVVSRVAVRAQAPNSISFSGLLTTPQGEPRDGVFNIMFRIFPVPFGGTALHQQSIDNVVVRGGQLSVLLGPFTPDVFAIGGGDRYVELQVQGEAPLLPRQRLVSVPFALNGVPPGAIVLFANNCPAGWSRFAALDNKFPMGQPNYGATGGSALHTHPISTDGTHAHNTPNHQHILDHTDQGRYGRTLVNPVLADGSIGGASGLYTASNPGFTADLWVPRAQTQNSGAGRTDTQGTHNHGGVTGSESSLPPYLAVVFCQKQ
jgi:hypothetical protein